MLTPEQIDRFLTIQAGRCPDCGRYAECFHSDVMCNPCGWRYSRLQIQRTLDAAAARTTPDT